MLCKKKMLQAMAVLSSFMVMAASSASFAGIQAKADTLSDHQSKIEQLEKEIASLNKENEENKQDAADKQKYVDTLNKKIDEAEAVISVYDNQVDEINSDIKKLDSDIAEKEKEIQEKEAENEERYQQLRQRVRAISKTGNVSALQMLMDTDNYTDYLIRAKTMERTAEKDKILMDELEAKIKKINEEKAAVETQKGVQAAKRLDVENKMNSSTALKSQLEQDCATVTALKKQLDQSIQKTDKQIEEDTAEKERRSNEITRLIQESTKKNNSSGSSGSSSAAKYKYGGGTMVWPVPAVHNVSSGFGMRWGKMHRGIDISEGEVPVYGQSIVSAADGVVIYANSTNTWGGGYGYHVIVDHGTDSKGNSIVTVYAHCSQVLVSVGQQVKAGQTIAKVGKTGNVTGPHLHFEVRVNGIAVDPIRNGYVKAN